MGLDQEIQLSIVVLLSGLVVVFMVLIFLTFLIKGYGNVVKSLQAGTRENKDTHAPAVIVPTQPTSVSTVVPSVQAGITEETVAAISAAVYTLYGASSGRVASIRRSSQPSRSAWGMAGLLESTRPF